MVVTSRDLAVLIIIAAVHVGASRHKRCDFPPSLWCSSEQIAQQCQVYYQCAAQRQSKQQNDASAVEVALYYESLCPGCKAFTTQQLFPTWQKIAGIINITLVPYGNAHERQEGNKWVFECQHGPDECAGNIIQTCAMFLTKNISVYFPFIHCMEASKDKPEESGPQCAKEHDINYSPIEQCASGAQGNSLEHAMAVLTEQLNPPHQFVPWITLNGEHTDKIQEEAQSDLLKLVCDTYKGTKPSVCDRRPRLADICPRI